MRRIFQLAMFAMIIYGAYSWADRAMFDKLFLGYSFDYWDEDRPAILFFFESASIILLVAYAAHLSLVSISSIFKQNKKTEN